ncbi:MAG: amidase [Hyphomicrobiaceae bacterium]
MKGVPEGVVSLAEALAAGQITARAVVEHYFERIAAENGRINAYVLVLADQARAEADASDARHKTGRILGPLDGVPTAVKDNIDVAGVATSGGIGHYRDAIAGSDAFVVERLRAAGMPILGKLNMHEGALGATNDNPWFGRCENPHKAGYTPGGSSGGAGAAVAAGLCPVALGTDTLGSVRVPAAYCGIAGLKPTCGVVSTRGVMPLSWTLDHVGPLAPSVRDLMAVSKVLLAEDTGWARSRGMAKPARRSNPVRIGVPRELAGVSLTAEVAAAFETALMRLRGQFAVSEISLGNYDFAAMRREGLLISEVEAALHHADALSADPAGFSETFRTMLRFGASRPATRIAAAYCRIAEARLAARRAFAEIDAIVMPTTPQPAFAFSEDVPVNQADLTAFANIVGCPAACTPMGHTADGLPLSIQVVMPEFRDEDVLHLAAHTEALAKADPSE